MGKTNYHIMSKNKNISYDNLSKLIISAIEDEQFFNKETLIPKVRAILSGFKANVNLSRYNKIESPTDAAKRLRSLEAKHMEATFWKDKVKALVGEKIEGYYYELDQLREQYGFTGRLNSN
jgi:hypothetical protein